VESMGPWLLLVIAALIVACVSLYFHARQVESQARGEQSVITDELRDAEAALMSALEKLQRMDSALAAREQALTKALGPDVFNRVPAERVVSSTTARDPAPVTVPPEPVRSAEGEELEREPWPGSSITRREERARVLASPGVSALPLAQEEARPGARPPLFGGKGEENSGQWMHAPGARQPPHAGWRLRAVELAQAGNTPLQIARDLELPVGEVELALALRP
jgi:hypothetical protein